jgi:prephenate dehydratase
MAGIFFTMNASIAIQGFEGSFHQIAARRYFGQQVPVLPCATFRQVVEAVQGSQAGAGMMAIENSIAGSILPNYLLLQQARLRVAGEVYLPIRQHLLVNPGVALEDIREVHSHPMALQQCMEFLRKETWKLVETEDTALSALHVHQQGSRHIAAVAGSLAAELFHLHMAAKDIHTEKQNYTRFLVLKKGEGNEGGNKASLSFQTRNERGSLAAILTFIAESGISLSKLQSFPVPGSRWNYYFHADLEFEQPVTLPQLTRLLEEKVESLQVYGIYQNGQTSEHED